MRIDCRPGFFVLLLALTAPLWALGINKDSGGLAIKGYDPVAYFKARKPVKGSSSYAHTWHGAVWQFATEQNKQAFADDPEKYAPQYGGYCAYAVSSDSTAAIDPKAWIVAAGKLYLFKDTDTQAVWEQDMEGCIRRADVNWPRLH